MTAIQTLWQGESCCVVDKPAGIATQAPANIDSLESILRKQWNLSDGDYLAMVHRLDRPVSGVILVARTKRAARLLSAQFQAGRISKQYIAAVIANDATKPKTLNQQQAGQPQTWTDWLLKIPDQAKVQIVPAKTAGAKQATTEVEWIEGDSVTPNRLVRLRPLTGRMHQLRIQLASRGYPIWGDTLYSSQEESQPISGQESILLHAESIGFNDPQSARRIVVESPSARVTLP